MKVFIANFKKYRFLLLELIRKEIKLKYRNSVLGILWTLIEPFLTMLVLTFVFENLLGKGDESYPVYILCGRLLYSYFSTATKNALKSIRKNSGMIRKVYVPKYMYPLASTVSTYITFVISLVVLVGVAAFEKVKPTWHLLQAFVPLIIILVMATGVGMLLATIAVFFRDLEYLWSVALMLIMYTSAIFYKAEKVVATGHAWIFKINPLYSLICNFRNAIFGKPMDSYHLWFSLIFSVVVFAIGGFVFWKKQDDFILYI